MSPEQARGGVVGSAGDVFSLGVVICFAATGALPWGDGSPEQILDQAAERDPDLSGLSGELSALARQCLAKNPRERPTAKQILGELSDRELIGRLRSEPSRTALPGPAFVPPETAPGSPKPPGTGGDGASLPVGQVSEPPAEDPAGRAGAPFVMLAPAGEPLVSVAHPQGGAQTQGFPVVPSPPSPGSGGTGRGGAGGPGNPPGPQPPSRGRPAGSAPDQANRGKRRKARPVIVIIFSVALVLAAGIFAAVRYSPAGIPISSPTPTSKPSAIPAPPGCQAHMSGPNGNEPIGFVTSECFPVRSGMTTEERQIEGQMAMVASQIKKQNAQVTGPYRTVVFFGVMSATSGVVNPASLYQLRGTLYAQQQQNKGKPKFEIRVLLANAGNDFEDGEGVAQSIIQRAHGDHSIVGVVGIGQSWTFSLDAIQQLGNAGLPVIGTSITGDEMSGSSDPNFFRISPSDVRQAQLAATFARNSLHARTVLILANQNKYVTGANKDLYSDDLAQQFTNDYTENSTDPNHKVIETCDYGDQSPVEVYCGGKLLTVSELREHICQENPDLIFFAARAVTLPELFAATGGTCKLPTVLGSSDVPKYTGYTDLKNESTVYYLSFAPAKKSNCGTPSAHAYQTPAMCAFLGNYRLQYPYASASDADDNPVLTYDSSDAMLGNDALQTVIQAIDAAGGDPEDISGAGILRELDSGKILFNGASGLISFSARQHTSFDHPVYVTLLGQTLTVKISCGQYSDNSPPGNDLGCPTSRS